MKSTIIVVGASGGIGNKVAELLSKDFNVVGTFYKHPERMQNLISKGVKSKLLDLQNIKTIKDLFEEQDENLFAIVNCAGVVEFENKVLEKDIEIWHKTIAVNLTGNYLLSKVFYSKLTHGGRFIMISSTDSYFGGTITTSYAVSKSGVNSLTKSLSLVLADKQIRVNSIAPGWVITPMIKENGEEFLKKVADINPLKRNAYPEDVANLVIFLLSDQASYINGQVISVEGGYTNQDPTLLIEEALPK